MIHCTKCPLRISLSCISYNRTGCSCKAFPASPYCCLQPISNPSLSTWEHPLRISLSCISYNRTGCSRKAFPAPPYCCLHPISNPSLSTWEHQSPTSSKIACFCIGSLSEANPLKPLLRINKFLIPNNPSYTFKQLAIWPNETFSQGFHPQRKSLWIFSSFNLNFLEWQTRI